jgi:membrane associated rhomboid family serine protease
MAQPNPYMDFYTKWSEKTPFVTRTITLGIIIQYLLSFFIPLENYLGNVPQYSLFKFEIYRLILSPFVGNSILTLVLVIMSYPTLGSKMEWSMGSTSYLRYVSLLCVSYL